MATLRNAADGSEMMIVETADISKLIENGWKSPEVFVAAGRDGKTPDVGADREAVELRPRKEISGDRVYLSRSRQSICAENFYKL